MEYTELSSVFLRSVRVDTFTKKKLNHYLKENTSFKQVFLANWLVFARLFFFLVMLVLTLFYTLNDAETVGKNRKFLFGEFTISSETLDFIYYVFLVFYSLFIWLLIILSDLYEKYIIRYPFVVMVGMLEFSKRYVYPLFAIILLIEVINGWYSQATFLFVYLFATHELRKHLGYHLSIKATLLYCHYKYCELREMLKHWCLTKKPTKKHLVGFSQTHTFNENIEILLVLLFFIKDSPKENANDSKEPNGEEDDESY